MDKQKQIEEMQKDIAVRMAMAKGVAGSMNNGVGGWLSEYLYNAGYRKIPENAVLLTREEWEQRAYVHAMENELCKKCRERVAEAYEKIRKETAEKFAEKLKSYPIAKTWFLYNADGKINVVIDEICKEITESKV